MEYKKFTKFYESYFGEEIENPDAYLDKMTALDLKDFVEHCMEFNGVVLADVSIRFMCQVVIDEEVIETRTSTEEENIDGWISIYKDTYSRYGKKVKYLKGSLTEC